ncbi:MAG: BatA domain-containing protein [Pirellulales bacterium]
MQFIYSPLTWGFLLAAVPLLIHLINLMRHKRLEWAAMEFLLESYRRQRKWIWLKQLLLLLLRMLAIAAVVAMLANLVTSDQLTRIFSGQTTHHFVIVDDTLSMGDQQAGDSAFEAAQRVVGQIVSQAARQGSEQRITLVRVTQAGIAPPPGSTENNSRLDLVDQVIASDFDERWEQIRRRWSTSSLGIGPREALQLVAQQVAQAVDQRAVVYVIGDYRQRDWQEQSNLAEPLKQLQDAGCEIHAIRCVDTIHQNLALVGLELAEGTAAAGVPMLVKASIQNFGNQPAEQIELTLKTQWYATPMTVKPQTDELPKLVIDRIEPGETVTREAQVFFGSAGQHVVEATLPGDAVLDDNRRWVVVQLPESTRVLVIDGDAEQRNQFYLKAVFQPGERAVTGVTPDVHPESYLRNASRELLAEFDAVYLTDVPTLDIPAARLLNDFVREGGGLAIYFGPTADIPFYNRLWTEHQLNWIPLNLAEATDLPAEGRAASADVVGQDNPIFRVLASRPGQPNPFARSLRVNRYIAAETVPERPEGEVLAQLRNNRPLVVEQPVGRGRVITWLTTLAPQWNNWALEPTFPVVLLQQQARLASGRARWRAQEAGTPIRGTIDVSRLQRGIEFVIPSSVEGARLRIKRQFDQPVSDITQAIDYELGIDPATKRRTGETDVAGIYEVVRTTLSGDPDVSRLALNADATDGAMELADRSGLEQFWRTYGGQLHEAADWTAASLDDQRQNWSHLILYFLIVALILEQIFSYFCSYHLKPGGRQG